MPRGFSGREIMYCRKCITPNTRPRIVFDEEGVCNACRYAEEKQKIDWNSRREEFLEIIEQYRSKDGRWDCIVPWSGGKDSSMIAYQLKFEFNMNPLLVTFSPMMLNQVGNDNREAFIQLGFDNLFLRPNQKVERRLARRFFIERGNPKVAWEAGKEALPVQIAIKLNIPLVFYAEHGEGEYGGKVLHEQSRRKKDFTEVVEHIVGDDARNWVDDEISPNDLNPYIYPKRDSVEKAGVKVLYFAYFFRWSMYENYLFIKDKLPFCTNPKGRTDGTFTDFDSIDDKMDDVYYYMQFIKFGFGKAIRDASRMIQNGHMSREEAVELAQKYDAEFPREHLDAVLEYLCMDQEEFMAVVDKHRNDEVWKLESGVWELRHPLVK